MRDVGHHEAPVPLWRALLTDPGVLMAIGGLLVIIGWAVMVL